MSASSVQSLLPHAAPRSGDVRLVLYAVRRMAAGGIGDAYAASAFLTAFGIHFRRPLVLVRTLVREMSRVATRRVLVAPCCCPRMSAGEAVLVAALRGEHETSSATSDAIAGLLGTRDCGTVLASLHAVTACFHDLGRPL